MNWFKIHISQGKAGAKAVDGTGRVLGNVLATASPEALVRKPTLRKVRENTRDRAVRRSAGLQQLAACRIADFESADPTETMIAAKFAERRRLKTGDTAA